MLTEAHLMRLFGRRALEYVDRMGVCDYCGRPMTTNFEGEQPTDSTATTEHITPQMYHHAGDRFTNSRENRLVACHWCNAHRGTRPLDEWIGILHSLGLTQGIVSRIGSLVNDWMPSQDQSEAFAAWLTGAMVHTPAENLDALSEPLCAILEPVPVRRSIL